MSKEDDFRSFLFGKKLTVDAQQMDVCLQLICDIESGECKDEITVREVLVRGIGSGTSLLEHCVAYMIGLFVR